MSVVAITGAERRYAAAIVWSLVFSVSAKALPLFAGILLVRIFDKSEYGTYAFALTAINFVLTLTGVGIAQGLVQNISANLAKDANYQVAHSTRAALVMNVALGLIVAMGCGLIWLQTDTAAVVLLFDYAIPIVLAVILQNLNSIGTATLIGYEMYKENAHIGVYTGFFTSASMICGAYFFGVAGAIYGVAIGAGVQLLLQRAVLNRLSRLTTSSNEWDFRDIWRQIRVYGIPIFFSSLLVTPVNWWIATKIVEMPRGLENFAEFNVLNQWKMILLFLPMALSNFFIGRLSASSRSAEGAGRSSHLLGVSFVVIVLVSLGLLSVLFSEQVMSLYGTQYAHLAGLLWMIVGISLLAGFNSLLGNYLISEEKNWSGFAANLIWALGTVVGVAFATSRAYGVPGVLLAVLLAYVPHTAYQLFVIRMLGKSKLGRG